MTDQNEQTFLEVMLEVTGHPAYPESFAELYIIPQDGMSLDEHIAKIQAYNPGVSRIIGINEITLKKEPYVVEDVELGQRRSTFNFGYFLRRAIGRIEYEIGWAIHDLYDSIFNRKNLEPESTQPHQQETESLQQGSEEVSYTPIVNHDEMNRYDIQQYNRALDIAKKYDLFRDQTIEMKSAGLNGKLYLRIPSLEIATKIMHGEGYQTLEQYLTLK